MQGKIGMVSDAAKLFDLQHGQDTGETLMIIRVPAIIKTWRYAVRRKSLVVCHKQSMVIGQVLRNAIMGNSMYLAGYHSEMAFSVNIALSKPL